MRILIAFLTVADQLGLKAARAEATQSVAAPGAVSLRQAAVVQEAEVLQPADQTKLPIGTSGF